MAMQVSVQSSFLDLNSVETSGKFTQVVPEKIDVNWKTGVWWLPRWVARVSASMALTRTVRMSSLNVVSRPRRTLLSKLTTQERMTTVGMIRQISRPERARCFLGPSILAPTVVVFVLTSKNNMTIRRV